MGLRSNIKQLRDYFPDGPRREFEGKWCAAFVYHCCIQAGFNLPHRYPSKEFGTFAGVRAWLYWAKLRENRCYFSARNRHYSPEAGDIVVYDRLFDPGPHDHIGIVLAVDRKSLRVAEGNVNNLSVVLWRKRNSHVRGYIRIPNDYHYEAPNHTNVREEAAVELNAKPNS
jgi:hypothetical protein